MEVYADVVFLINFVMNTFILFITGILLRKKVKLYILLISGFLSSFLYCLFIFTKTLSSYYNFFIPILIIGISTFISFRPKNFKQMIKYIIFVHIVCFGVGGIGMGLFYYFNMKNLIGNMLGVKLVNLPLLVLITTVCTSYILLKILNDYIKKIISKKQDFISIEIGINGTSANIQVLVDTGNSLLEPITKKPVLICEFSSIKNLLPNDIRFLFYEKKEDDMSLLLKTVEDCGFKERFRMIPFKSLGKSHGMLFGFIPDYIKIKNQDELILKEKGEGIIGVCNFILSTEDNYKGLIGPEFLKDNI